MGGVGIAGSAESATASSWPGTSASSEHIAIGDRARIGGQERASSATCRPDTAISGHPARPHREFLRAQAAMYRLAPIVDELERLVAERSAAMPRRTIASEASVGHRPAHRRVDDGRLPAGAVGTGHRVPRGPICPARPEIPARLSRGRSPPSGAPPSAKARPPSTRWSTCWPRSWRSRSTIC